MVASSLCGKLTPKTTRRNIGFQRAQRSQRPARGRGVGQTHGEIDIISQITKQTGRTKKISSVNLWQHLASLCETDITYFKARNAVDGYYKRNLIMNEHNTGLMCYMLDCRLNRVFSLTPRVCVKGKKRSFETMLEKTSSHPLCHLCCQCTGFSYQNPGLFITFLPC